MGIDYGSRRAYYAVLDAKKLYLTGSLVYPGNSPEILLRAFRTLLREIEGLRAVYIEQPQHLSEALEMAMMASRLETVAILEGLPVTFVHPSTWRKGVLGNGRANKADAVAWAKETYSYEPPSLKVRSYEPDHNRCEALAIAQYGIDSWIRNMQKNIKLEEKP